VIFCRGDVLKPGDLFLDGAEKPPVIDMGADISKLPFKEAKDRMLADFHQRYVEALLKESGGNVSRAAEKAGIQRQYFHRLMKDAGILSDEFKARSETEV
jgi:DNA-binding NtrC family response regulator